MSRAIVAVSSPDMTFVRGRCSCCSVFNWLALVRMSIIPFSIRDLTDLFIVYFVSASSPQLRTNRIYSKSGELLEFIICRINKMSGIIFDIGSSSTYQLHIPSSTPPNPPNVSIIWWQMEEIRLWRKYEWIVKCPVSTADHYSAQGMYEIKYWLNLL